MREADRQMLLQAKRETGGFHNATKWYLREWTPMDYQYVWHQVAKLNGTWVGGVATAKTATTAASNLMDCLAYPYFRSLNTSVTQKQAELPFYMIQAWMEGNKRLEHLIEDIVLRPYPMITFKNYSQYEFRTAGADARFIRGFEYDRIGYDECALDLLGRTVEVLRHRLRGTRPDGTTRLARLDTISSPGAVLWFKERYRKGFDPEYTDLYFSMRTTTYDNIHLTREQIAAMEMELSAETARVELGAEWPDYGGSYFPEVHIDACVNQSLYDAVYLATNPEDPAEHPEPGYRLEEDARAGITRFEMPYIPGKLYVLAGDFGRDNPPRRNAGVVLVADVTSLPNRLVYCDWVFGNGSVNPFLNSYKYAIEKYYPVKRGIDATGPQQMVDEIAFENLGIATDKINYSTDKWGMLNELQYDLSNHRWSIPPIQGLVKHAKTYLPEKDKDIPQDLITTWAQLAHVARMAQPQNETPGTVATSYDPRLEWILRRHGRTSPLGRRRRVR